jgi:hypothetical protein
LDAQTFNVTPPIKNKSDMLNFTDNRHGIEGYLADPVVARQLVLELKSQSEIMCGCARRTYSSGT